MASAKALTGLIVMVIGIVTAALTYDADLDDAYDWMLRAENLFRMYTFGVALAGLGAGVLAASIGARLGPQFKSMNYCPFCGLEKAPPYATCERCGKKFEY